MDRLTTKLLRAVSGTVRPHCLATITSGTTQIPKDWVPRREAASGTALSEAAAGIFSRRVRGSGVVHLSLALYPAQRRIIPIRWASWIKQPSSPAPWLPNPWLPHRPSLLARRRA
jgi:hypothetical protein